MAFVAGAAAITVAGAGDHGTVVVTDPDGRALARVPLGADGAFTLRYRNSLYGMLAAERFVALGTGGFALDALLAEQVAILEEYYAVDESPERAGSGWWTAPPPYELSLDELRVAATDLGRRTLVVDGQAPVELWRLVSDRAPSVLITVEGVP